MGFGQVTHCAGDCDVGVTNGIAEPVGSGPSTPVSVQHVQNTAYLGFTALDPGRRRFIVQSALVEQAYRLVIESRRQRTDLQRLPTRRTRFGDERSSRADQLV